jgi:hypothetical protein
LLQTSGFYCIKDGAGLEENAGGQGES